MDIRMGRGADRKLDSKLRIKQYQDAVCTRVDYVPLTQFFEPATNKSGAFKQQHLTCFLSIFYAIQAQSE